MARYLGVVTKLLEVQDTMSPRFGRLAGHLYGSLYTLTQNKCLGLIEQRNNTGRGNCYLSTEPFGGHSHSHHFNSFLTSSKQTITRRVGHVSTRPAAAL